MKAAIDLMALYGDIRDGKRHEVVLNYDAEETKLIGTAAAALVKAVEDNRKLREILAVYANEFFYDELPPSKAKEDRGAMARRVLNETHPDGVV